MNKNKFLNKKVLVVGLGRFGGGLGVINYLLKQGAKVKVTDLKTKDKLKDSLDKLDTSKVELVLGEHREDDLIWADVVVFSPAVMPSSPFYQLALKLKKPIETEMNLFFKLCPAKIIGVTGTNGKATVSGLIFNILKQGYGEKRVFLGGNMGVSVLEQVEQLSAKDWFVVELSSFQLARLGLIKKSPQIGVLTNITPDHVEWHGDFDRYVKDKLNIFRFQNDSNWAFVNFYDPVSAKRLKRWPFRSRRYVLGDNGEAEIVNETELKIEGRRFMLPDHKLIGWHNVINIAQAVMVGKALGIKEDQIKKGIQEFEPVEHALEYVAEIEGVKFINDSEASNQDAALKALEALPKGRIVLIAGGYDKGVDLSEFASQIKANVKEVVLIGQTADKIAGLLNKLGYHNWEKVESLKEAVDKAFRKAEPGDYVLLSPAASSFDMFANLEQRGELFKKYVARLKVS